MALKAAMMRHYDKQEQLVRPLRSRLNNGYTVVVEKKGDLGNEFTTEVSLKVDADGDLEVTNGYVDYDDRLTLQRLIHYFRKMLPAASVSDMLISIVKDRLGGVNLKDRGGLYFIREQQIADFEQVRIAVEGAASKDTQNCVSAVTLELNDSTMRDIHHNLTREVKAEMDAINAELAANDCGEQALSNRVERCVTAMNRMKQYESLLGQTLTDCRDALRVSFAALAAAQAAKDADIFDVATA